jgi:outer membrane protein
MMPIIPLFCVQEIPKSNVENFTLERALSVGVEQSTTIANAKRAILADTKRAEAVAIGTRPTISANANALRFDQATRIAFGSNAPPITTLPDHSEAFSLTIAKRLDLFGQIKTATDQAKLQSLADTFALQGAIRAKRLQIATAYFALLKARDQIKVANANVLSAQNLQKQAKTLYEGGIGQKLDVLKSNTLIAQSEQAVEAAKNGEAIARATFNDTVHLPLSTPVELENVPLINAQLPDEATITKSIESRDDILQTQTLARAQLLGVTLAQNANRPTVALQAATNYYPTSSFQYPRKQTANVGVSLSVPISDGGLARTHAEEAKIRAETAEAMVGTAKANAALEAMQALLNLRTALKQIETTRIVTEQARAARYLAEVRYKGQVGLFLELSDAQNTLTRAEIAEIDALYDYHTARARFENAAPPASQ